MQCPRRSIAAAGRTEERRARKFRKDELAAGWRRTGKELGMAVADHSAHRNGLRLGAHLDQNHDCRGHRNRRRRVHGNAQLAMVGIAAERMHVRDLSNGQQRQQGKTQHSDRRQSAQLCRPSTAEMCRKSRQIDIPCISRIHSLDARGRRRVPPGGFFSARGRQRRKARLVYTVGR